MADKNVFGEVPQVVHNAVLNALDSLEERPPEAAKKGAVWRYIPRVAVLVFICVLLTGMTVSTVASVRELYKQRMEELTKEDYEEFYNMWDENYNRQLTSEEMSRYKELEEMYQKNGVFPESQITTLEEGEVYNGKGIAWDSVGNAIYFPQEELSDEELLQLIDYRYKRRYSVYMLNEERLNAESGWRSRAAQMTSEEIEELYKMRCYANGEVSGAYSRVLSQEESARFEELEQKYEEEGLFAQKGISIIRYREDYSGDDVTFCIQDSTYHFPERELTDDEMLQIIDFEHMVSYAFGKINEEIDLGLREDYPEIIRDYELFRRRMEAMDKEELEAFYHMCENNSNRQLTEEELSRFEELEDTYKREGVFPATQMAVLEEGEVYSGKRIAFDKTGGTVYFPQEELVDEELLQLIDYRNKHAYSVYILQEEQAAKEIPWRGRMADITYEELLDFYLDWGYADTEVRGGFYRELSREERARFDELNRKYEEEGLFSENGVCKMQKEDYAGEGVAFCRDDCTFYFPERELTDDEMLQIIDFSHKARYACEKIDTEVDMGLREKYIIYR